MEIVGLEIFRRLVACDAKFGIRDCLMDHGATFFVCEMLDCDCRVYRAAKLSSEAQLFIM